MEHIVEATEMVAVATAEVATATAAFEEGRRVATKARQARPSLYSTVHYLALASLTLPCLALLPHDSF